MFAFYRANVRLRDIDPFFPAKAGLHFYRTNPRVHFYRAGVRARLIVQMHVFVLSCDGAFTLYRPIELS